MSLVIKEMTSEDLKEMMDEHKRLNPDLEIRPDIKDDLDNWAKNGDMPGDFLRAVLENNLMNAIGRADSYNRATIFQICSYIYNELPGTCHGSEERVLEYYNNFHEEQESEL